MKKTLFNFLIFSLLLLFTSNVQAQNTVRGTIMDEAANESLIGANILIKGTSIGTNTDIDGNFTLTSDTPLPWTLEISYTGYSTKEVVVENNNSNITVNLTEGVVFGEDIVISASRKREKVQEAPASISVLTARKLETSANATDATRNLVNTAGVQIQQQSANRINISMRGGAGLFGTSVFPIMDYRSLVGPGIGTFQTDGAGISNIDLQRIEVVRGPGSALYGPGVTQGVVHFITKNPIDFPGTTIEVMGGELNTIGGGFRHATKVSDKFGFKINGQYRQGNEFILDGSEGTFNSAGVFERQIDKFKRQIVQPSILNGTVDPNGTPRVLLDSMDLDPDGDGNMMQDDWFNGALNATLEFRPKDNLGITLSGGFNAASSVFYNEQGEGLAQSNEIWTQARVQAGGFFGQVFFVDNDGGTEENPTFLYQTGNRTPVGRQQVEAQAQYNFGAESFLNSDWTVGADYRLAKQDTESLVYGRNEDDDDFSVVGAYVQGKFGLSPKLDLVLAGRYDQFNFIDEGAFAPRAALVFKASPTQTFRASYNQASTTVSNLQLNIDFPLSDLNPGVSNVWLFGNKVPQTFENGGTAWMLPGIPTGLDQLPLGVPYVAVNAPTVAGFTDALMGTLLEPFIGVFTQVLNPVGAVDPASPFGVDPTTLGLTGQLSPGFNIFDGTPLGIIDAPISKISTEQTLEVGYKGLLGKKVGVMLDVYQVTQKNNSQFTAISPAYILLGRDQIGADLGVAMWTQTGPQFQAILEGAGLTGPALAQAMGQLEAGVNAAYTQGGAGFAAAIDGLPFHAFTPTDQVPDDGINHLAAGYRTFDERSFIGADFGLEYYVNDDMSAFFNYSWVNKNEFMQKVVGNEGAGELPTYLNIPKNKFRLGLNYTPVEGFRGSIAFQHDDAYVASAGQYSTDDPTTPDVVEKTDPRNLVDVTLGYKMSNGLAIDLSATNVLDTKYRYLPNMPEIGRRALAKLTYTFGTGEKKN